VFLFRPHRLLHGARWFTQHFPGEVYYAVKANPSVHFLKSLWEGGVRGFDVASLTEVKLVSSLFPNARLAFMHPVKNRSVIAEAYFVHGVRRFVLDSLGELEKIMSATNHATDLTLVVRFAVASYGSSLPLTGKFGVSADESTLLLQESRKCGNRLGISFHVGSQAMKPLAYDMALSLVADQIEAAGVTVDVVDVGGGFPSVYDMEAPPPMEEYMATVVASVQRLPAFANASLWCEPGRALSAEGEGLLTRIEGVKSHGDKRAIYLNDGSFGALYDVIHEQWKYPCRVVTSTGAAAEQDESDLVPFAVYGPTCDSADKFPEPVMLPRSMVEGDYLEWGNIGAYGRCMATSFNGFGSYETVTVTDSPWPSLYRMTAVSSEVPWATPSKTTRAYSLFDEDGEAGGNCSDCTGDRTSSPDSLSRTYSPDISVGSVEEGLSFGA
jgi:ornithine decarboxylase